MFSVDTQDLLEDCVISDNHTTGIAQESTEVCQKTVMMGKHKSEMKNRISKIVQERNKPKSQASIFTPCFADMSCRHRKENKFHDKLDSYPTTI